MVTDLTAARQLGKSEVSVSPIIFGAWAIGGWMWGGQDEGEAIEAIHASIDAGVNTIDTAAIYGMGQSEEIVGRAIAGRREKVVIATKCGMRWNAKEGSEPWPNKTPRGEDVVVLKNGKAESIAYECEQSLKRLKVDVIDLYQVHWPDVSTRVEETVGALEKLRKEGKVRAIGVSNYDVEWLEGAVKAVERLGGVIASDQPAYSLITRKIEKGVLPWCREHGVGVIVYSPLERGLLAGAVPPERVFAEGDHRRGHKYFGADSRRKILEALEEIRPIAEGHKASFAQVVINWTIQEPGITAALVGARNAEQARHNAGALAFVLSADERATIRRVFDPVARELGGTDGES